MPIASDRAEWKERILRALSELKEDTDRPTMAPSLPGRPDSDGGGGDSVSSRVDG